MRFPKFAPVLILLCVCVGTPAQTGTDWRLVSPGPTGNEAGVVPGTTVTLTLGDGRASGSTSNQASGRDNESQDDRTDPIGTLSSYYNAINSRDFRRAYSYWESAPSSYEQFERGFAETDRVRLLIEPPPRLEGAAGSSFAEIPAIIVATTRRGRERVFAGCYTLRKSNVRDRGWHIYRATISAVPATARVSRMLAQGCRNSQ